MPTTPDLLDVSVWLALVDRRHVHHPAAERYWNQHPDGPLAFCRLTMLGFLRLSTNAHALPNPLTPQEAWKIYRQLLALPIVRFLPEADGIEAAFATLTLAPDFPRRLWTDAFLAAFAITSGCRLVSFDADFSRFPQLNFLLLQRRPGRSLPGDPLDS